MSDSDLHRMSLAPGARTLQTIHSANSHAEQTAPTDDASPPSPETILGMDAGEFRRSAVLAALLFVVSCVFVLGRTVRDALFLSYYGDRVGGALPWMFIAFGASSAVVAVVYARVVRSVKREHFVAGTALGVALAYLLARLALPWSPSWFYSVLYVGSEIAGNLLLAQFWSVANDLHDPRSAKRLFGVIGLGRIVGVVMCGLGAGSFVAAVGTENLLIVLAAMSASIVGFIWWLVREHGLGRGQKRAAPRAKSESILAPLRNPYLRAIGVLILLAFIAVNVGDFQFKAAARIAHPSRDELALFMARYYATMGAIALALQLLVTRPLLRRFGVGGGLLVLPIAYGLANLLMVASPSVFSATIVKISDNAVQFTVFEATMQLLYFPLEERDRDAARATLDALIKPLGYGIAGVLVLVFARVLPATNYQRIAAQSWLVLPLVLAWIVVVFWVRRGYVTTLERSLQRRTAEPSDAPLDDKATREILLHSAVTSPERAACYAIEQLRDIAPSVAVGQLDRWLERPEPSVRVAAMQAAGSLGGDHAILVSQKGMHDESTRVVIAAVHTFAALRGESSLDALEPLLLDSREKVQDAVVIALLRHGGLEGALRAGELIEQWVRHDDATQRRRAAMILGMDGVPGALRLVRGLLGDQSVSVRREALRAASSAGDVFCGAMIDAIADPASRSTASEALVRVGAPAIMTLKRRLEDAEALRTIRLQIPRILAQIGTDQAYQVLLDHVTDSDRGLRQKALASASRVKRAHGLAPVERVRVERLILAELSLLELEFDGYVRFREWFGMVLLDRWLLQEFKRAMIRVLRLLELSPDGGRRIESVRDAIFTSDVQRRGRAIELLEAATTTEIARRFVTVLDRWLQLRATVVTVPRGERPEGVDEYVRALWQRHEPFAKVLALDASQFRGAVLLDTQVKASLAHIEPTVRELAALVVVTAKLPSWREDLGGLLEDEDEVVRDYVRFALATGQTGMEPNDNMYTTLEKVLFLQGILLFSEVAPEDLLELARSAEVVHLSPGAKLFGTGDPGDALYIVVDGTLETRSAGGQTHTYRVGEAFGELAVLDGTVRSDDATAVGDASVLKIARDDFTDVLRANGPLAEAVIRVLVQRLRVLRSQ
ncbi:MAG: Npt1/Npt2 family nucleotide transporter [Deltaproteobacteria bacterium]|nr:Npt1/Npt2 family nucleotide transporter [Deltaproteobacteria bacterium]